MDPRSALKNLPAFLQVTDDQIAISERIQAQARQAMFGRVQANQEEARLMRGIYAERAARANLDVLANHESGDGKEDAIRFQIGRLADAYADQGRYAEAAKTHPDKQRQKEFSAIQKAIERPDSAACKCPAEIEVKDPVGGNTLRIPVENRVEDVFSIKHGRMMPLVRCEHRKKDGTICGFLNVKPLPASLVRREALSVTAQFKKHSDAEALK